jgi:hypothetical protein
LIRLRLIRHTTGKNWNLKNKGNFQPTNLLPVSVDSPSKIVSTKFRSFTAIYYLSIEND